MKERDPQLDAFAVDVRELMERSVANLYSHLVTRPTGRAVRLAIEQQLAEIQGPALSLVDLSSVAVLDFSCADEVVARLLLRALEDEDWNQTFFVFRGLRPHHREPIEAVLERHSLAAVAQMEGEGFQLVGIWSEREGALWDRVEEWGRVPADSIPEFAAELGDASRVSDDLDALVRRRLLFRHPLRGDLLALSTLAGTLS